jgi:hypothetical protein
LGWFKGRFELLYIAAMMRTPRVALRVMLVLALAAAMAWPARGWAEATTDRFSAGGYFRIMARPDFEGGWGRLGFSNLSGRLLNEGPYAALELKLDVLKPNPGTNDTWASVHAKIEGGSVQGAEPNNGSLTQFRLSQLYVRAGNVLLENVVWQLGTLYTYFGDLGLYDLRPTELFFETVGVSGLYRTKHLDLLLGVGDSGYYIRGTSYSAILTFGGSLRVRIVDGLEVGLGGELFYEPEVRGDRDAPYETPLPPGITFEDFWRRRIVARYLELNPGMLDEFPHPTPTSAMSYKLIGYVGFGKLGPLRWNNLYAFFQRRHPDNFYTETAPDGRPVTIFVKSLTDQRYQAIAGDEAQFTVIPNRLDLVWAALFGWRRDYDNTIAASEDNEIFYSTVLRVQTYLTRTLHFLAETSLAREHSLQGNLWRGHYSSIFTSTKGLANTEGLEFGDLNTRDTWQLKGGFVLNPTGTGIFTRPSLRLLYGLQWSNMHNAFGNGFVQTLDQFNVFAETGDRHWHQVVSLEAEAWF